MFYRIIMVLIGAGLLYGSGWNLMIDGELKVIPSLAALLGLGGLSYGDIIFNSDNYNIQDMSYFLSGQLAVINVNDLYYGLYNNHRYFNSPILEWIGIGLGIGAVWESIFPSSKDVDNGDEDTNITEEKIEK